MEMSTIAYPDLLPAEIVPGPGAQMKKKKNPPRPSRWRGWVDPKIIDRKHTEIMKRLKYFDLFDVAYP